MNYSRLNNVRNLTYYQFVVCDDKDKYGHHLYNEYKNLNNALKKFDELISSGLYTWITLRKEEVFCRCIPTTEISCSTCLKAWDIDKGIYMNELFKEEVA